MEIPLRFELVGESLALKWPNGDEDYFDAPFLRERSPSADQAGEMDIFGRISGGSPSKSDFSEVKIRAINPVGNYGLRLSFSDGHATGIFSWDLLKALRSEANTNQPKA